MGVGLLHVPGMGKNFGGELGEQAGEIVVLFTIGPGRKFEHALAASPHYLTRLIRHLIHLSKKLTLRRPVPDISAAKSFCGLESEFPAVSLHRPRGALPPMTVANLYTRPRNQTASSE